MQQSRQASGLKRTREHHTSSVAQRSQGSHLLPPSSSSPFSPTDRVPTDLCCTEVRQLQHTQTRHDFSCWWCVSIGTVWIHLLNLYNSVFNKAAVCVKQPLLVTAHWVKVPPQFFSTFVNISYLSMSWSRHGPH